MRTFEQARDFAQRQGRDDDSPRWYNLCQMFSRQCVGAAPFGVSAREAFNNARPRTGTSPRRRRPGRSPTTATRGRASGTRSSRSTAGSSGPTTSCDKGLIDRVRWDVFQSRWRLPYRGWIDGLPGRPAARAARQRRARATGSGKRVYAEQDATPAGRLGQRLEPAGGADQPVASSSRTARPATTATTRRCVAAFQHRRGWTGSDADGIAGPSTIDKLGLVWAEG